MLSKNAVEKDSFPTQLFIASVFRSAVLMLIDFWFVLFCFCFYGNVEGVCEGLSTFLKIKWRRSALLAVWSDRSSSCSSCHQPDVL